VLFFVVVFLCYIAIITKIETTYYHFLLPGLNLCMNNKCGLTPPLPKKKNNMFSLITYEEKQIYFVLELSLDHVRTSTQSGSYLLIYVLTYYVLKNNKKRNKYYSNRIIRPQALPSRFSRKQQTETQPRAFKPYKRDLLQMIASSAGYIGIILSLSVESFSS